MTEKKTRFTNIVEHYVLLSGYKSMVSLVSVVVDSTQRFIFRV